MTDFHDIRQLAQAARQLIREVTPVEAKALVRDGALLVDVRDDEELLRNPPLAGALHLTRGRLEYLITDAVSDKREPLVLYCAGGNRGALAAASLTSLGYASVFNVSGGLQAWRKSEGKFWYPSPRFAPDVMSGTHASLH